MIIRRLALILALLTLAGCTDGPVGASPTGSPLPSSASEPPSPSPPGSSEAGLPVYSGPENEYLPLLAACLREAGWQVTASDRGDEMSGVIPPEQRAAYHAAERACQSQIGTPPTPRPATLDEIRARYDYLVEMRQCLIDLGYTLAEPPTFEVFADSWATGPWSPYNEVADTANRDQWAAANEQCPQLVLAP